VARARELGALGATISGAGPSVLFWAFFEQTGDLVGRLREEAAGWADVQRVNFVLHGADVAAL
jgi:homoserine kinase